MLKQKGTVEDKREHSKVGFEVKRKPLDQIAKGLENSLVVGEGFPACATLSRAGPHVPEARLRGTFVGAAAGFLVSDFVSQAADGLIMSITQASSS